MNPRTKMAHVGKIEILPGDKFPFGLIGRPNFGVRGSREIFSGHGVHIVPE